jgi:hypothetical protein
LEQIWIPLELGGIFIVLLIGGGIVSAIVSSGKGVEDEHAEPAPEPVAAPAAAPAAAAAYPPPPTPAGWKPDPTGRHRDRYWNGSDWTADVSDDGIVSKDPL